jgi:AcrR family transcriptional regulator
MKQSLPPSASLDSQDARLRLLQAAQEEFAEQGFDAATVRAICKRAGANIGGINYYFGSKEELYIEAVKYAHTSSAWMERFPIPSAETPPVEKLKTFIREMVVRMHATTSRSAMKLMMREMADPGKAAHVVVEEFMKPSALALKGILRELLPHADEPQILATGLSVMGQILFYRQNRPVAEMIFGKDAIALLDVDRVVDHITQFTLAAIGYAEPLFRK